VTPYNLLKITNVSEETTTFIFYPEDGAYEISVNFCQNTVDFVSRLRAARPKNRGLILGVSKKFISSSRRVEWFCDHPVSCPWALPFVRWSKEGGA
jgi:hypothetical protein